MRKMQTAEKAEDNMHQKKMEKSAAGEDWGRGRRKGARNV